MILFDYVVQILALTETHSPRQPAICLQRLYRRRKGRILVNMDDSRHGIACILHRFPEKAFGRGGIPFGGEQKINRLTGRVHRAV